MHPLTQRILPLYLEQILNEDREPVEILREEMSLKDPRYWTPDPGGIPISHLVTERLIELWDPFGEWIWRNVSTWPRTLEGLIAFFQFHFPYQVYWNENQLSGLNRIAKYVDLLRPPKSPVSEKFSKYVEENL